MLDESLNELYSLAFTDLNNITTGNRKLIDGFILVKKISETNYKITISNALFTGAFDLNAPNSTCTVSSYDADSHYLSLDLEIDADDVAAGSIVLQLVNVDMPFYPSNDIYITP